MRDVHICSFDAVYLPRGKNLTYETFKESVLRAGRFSVFEATASTRSAKLYDRLCSDVEVELDKSLGFPWTGIKRRPIPLCDACKGLKKVERLERIVGRHHLVHMDPCLTCDGTGFRKGQQ